MFEQLLPDGVVPVEAFTDLPGEPVFPGEENLIAAAVETRRREFVTARRCAREALGRLGLPAVAIGRGPCRDPQWPDGVVGSITHCPGFRAAAVSRNQAGLGIDAERHEPLPPGLLGAVALPAERAMLADLAAAHPATCWDRLLFSAKESVYKAWYPATGERLRFRDARLTVDTAAGTFHAHVPGARLTGRFLVGHGLALTALTVT